MRGLCIGRKNAQCIVLIQGGQEGRIRVNRIGTRYLINYDGAGKFGQLYLTQFGESEHVDIMGHDVEFYYDGRFSNIQCRFQPSDMQVIREELL